MELLSFDVNTIEVEDIQDEKIKEAIQEIKFVYTNLKQKGVNIQFDPYIVRGLDYYS